MLASKVCRQLSEVLKGESEKWFNNVTSIFHFRL